MTTVKKILLAMISVAFASPLLWAGRPEVSVCYGALPAMRFIGAYHNHWNKMNPWGAVTVTLEYRFAQRWSLGFNYTISSASSKAAILPDRKGAIAWHAMMGVARFEPLRRNRFTGYFSLGAGMVTSCMQPDDEQTFSRTQFAFQVTPLGVAYELLDNVDIFAEIGFGVQGIVKTGLRIDM